MKSGRSAHGNPFRRFHLNMISAIIFLCLFNPLPVPQMLWADSQLTYLKSLEIEALLETEVTSVSKKSEKLSDTTAAVFVITAEDIRRAGARTIAEALRMAPGIQVSRVDSNKWTISSRGFNDTFSNKLLVLIDGRSVYTPLYSGVYWDIQDTLMEDIDRIEVIRGPGATLWGANAVNGVINIITKTAQETQGALITMGAGSHETYDAGVRYGDRLGTDGAWRIYAKTNDRDGFDPVGEDQDIDSWRRARGGFRMDLDLNAQDAFTLQGDVYQEKKDQIFDLTESLTTPALGPQPYIGEAYGANLLTRWRRAYGDASDLTFQLYLDRTDRKEIVLEEKRDTLDFDFQHRFQLTPRQEVIWGLGYRHTRDETWPGQGISITPDSRADQLFSGFVQDEFTLKPDKWWLTIGSKFEHNDYTGYEIQPNLRLRWKPGPQQTAWAAIARAVRTPSRGEHNFRSNQNVQTVTLPFPPYTTTTYLTAYFGDPDFTSEDLTAYELGYRFVPHNRFSIDLAAFYNVYDNLRTIEPTASAAFLETDPLPPHIVVPIYVDNKMEGETFGIELVTVWQPVSFWKLTAGYSWLQMLLRTDPDSSDITSEKEAGYSPVNQIQLRSALDLPHGWSLDTELYYIDELSEMDVDGYTRLDLRLGWQPRTDLEFSINIENLLDDRHPEYGLRNDIVPAQIPRLFYGQITWRF